MATALKNWINKHWVLILLMCIGWVIICISFFMWLIMFFFKSSGAYKGAMEEVKSSSEVQQVLGTPIKDKFFATGEINSSSNHGEADIVIRIKGSKDSAKVYVKAEKVEGDWQFYQLTVKLDSSGKKIDLISGNNSDNILK